MKRTAKNLDKRGSSVITGGTEHVEIIPVPGRPKVYRVKMNLGIIEHRTRYQERTVEGLANARKIAQEMEANRGTVSVCTKKGNKGIALAEALERYLRAGKNSWSPKTYQTKLERLNRYLLPALGANTPCANITPLAVQSVQDALSEKLAATTVKAIMLTTGAFFSQLESWGVIPSNPCTKLTTIKGAKGKVKEIWTPEQVDSVLSDSDCPLWLRLLLVLGCRPEELQGLSWKQVDFEQGGVHIQQVAYYDTKTKTWKVRQGAKTASSVRFIPLDNDTLDVLRSAREQAKGPFVIPATRGGIVPVVTLRFWLNSYATAKGLPVIALYALRHSSITYLLEAGVMVKTVAARAGHSNTATTLQHYATVTDGAAKAAAECFALKH